MQTARALSWISLFLLLACGGGGEGPPEPISEDPHQALLPAQCRLERKGEDCKSCVAECCAPCHAGSECIRFRACFASCAGHLGCIRDCGATHPEGESDWLRADTCAEFSCADRCGG